MIDAINNLLAQHFHSADAFVSAIGACHRALTPGNVTQLEASQGRYRLAAQRLEAATLDFHPLEKMGIAALLEAQRGASQGICWGFRSRLCRQEAEARLGGGDCAGAAQLEAEADKLQAKILDIADGVFDASELSLVVGMMMPMGAEVAA